MLKPFLMLWSIDATTSDVPLMKVVVVVDGRDVPLPPLQPPTPSKMTVAFLLLANVSEIRLTSIAPIWRTITGG